MSALSAAVSSDWVEMSDARWVLKEGSVMGGPFSDNGGGCSRILRGGRGGSGEAGEETDCSVWGGYMRDVGGWRSWRRAAASEMGSSP